MSELETKVNVETGLFKKLSVISMEMGKLPKTGYNSFHKYKYVTESDAMDRFRGLCYSHGVIVIPSASSPSVSGDLTSVDVTYTIIDVATGQSLTCMVPGQGQDKGDKGIYKALTGSFKYFILKTFLVPSGDDPERDDRPISEPAWKDKSGGVLIEGPSESKPHPSDVLAKLDKEQQEIFGAITDRLFELCGTNAKQMEELMLMVSEWRDANGELKREGVVSPYKLLYSKRGKAPKSQAQFALDKLNQIDADTIDTVLAQWRAL